MYLYTNGDLFSVGNIAYWVFTLGGSAILLLIGRIKISIKPDSPLLEKWRKQSREGHALPPSYNPTGSCELLQTVYGPMRLWRALGSLLNRWVDLESALMRWVARGTMIMLFVFLVIAAIWIAISGIIAEGINTAMIPFFAREMIMFILLAIVPIAVFWGTAKIVLKEIRLCPRIIVVREPEH